MKNIHNKLRWLTSAMALTVSGALVSQSVFANQAPVAFDDKQFRIQKDIGPTGITFSTLLRNDVDPDGDTLEIVDVDFYQFPGEYEVDFDAPSPSVTFTLQDGFTGKTGFVYTVSDGEFFDEATVEIDVNSPRSPARVNTAPVASDDRQFEIQQGVGATIIDFSTLMRNDSDPEGDEIKVVDVDVFQFPGSFEEDFNRGRVVFSVDSEFVGTTGFVYVISDGEFFSEATVEISVVDNTAPQPEVNIARLSDFWKGLYLHVGNNTSTNVVSYKGTDSWWSQQWVLEKVENNVVRIKNRWSGLCMSASDVNEWSSVYVTDCVDSWWSQRWVLKNVNFNNQEGLRIQNQWSKLYLNASGKSNGALRQARLNKNWSSQVFSAEYLESIQ